jgi:hypothetical protein
MSTSLRITNKPYTCTPSPFLPSQPPYRPSVRLAAFVQAESSVAEVERKALAATRGLAVGLASGALVRGSCVEKEDGGVFQARRVGMSIEDNFRSRRSGRWSASLHHYLLE